MYQSTFDGKIDEINSKIDRFRRFVKAVHGSLQKRLIILDSDFSRANDFPVDYETDIEFEWANPSKTSKLDDDDDDEFFVFRFVRRWK